MGHRRSQIYERNDPAREWADGEDEEEEVPTNRLQLASKQELPPARETPRPFLPSPGPKKEMVSRKRKKKRRPAAGGSEDEALDLDNEEGLRNASSSGSSSSSSSSDSDEDSDEDREDKDKEKGEKRPDRNSGPSMLGGMGGSMGMMGMMGSGMRREGRQPVEPKKNKMQKVRRHSDLNPTCASTTKTLPILLPGNPPYFSVIMFRFRSPLGSLGGDRRLCGQKMMKAMGAAVMREVNRATCNAANMERALGLLRGVGAGGGALRQLERTEQAELRCATRTALLFHATPPPSLPGCGCCGCS